MTGITHREHLVVLRHRNHLGLDPRGLQRACAKGELVRLRSGAYIAANIWAALDLDERIRLEAAAAHEAGRGAFIASHATAAAVWGIPRLFAPDGLLHTRVTVAAGTRTEHGVRKHAVVDLDLHMTTAHGIPTTTRERTIVDLALSSPFAAAVVAADWVLRFHTTREALRTVLDEVDPKRGRARAEAVIEFADPLSGSAGESWSRVQMAEAGLQRPSLQEEFTDDRGRIGFVDFYWPDLRLVGEFDGMQKYTDEEMLGGRTAQQAFRDEKLRQSRLQTRGESVTRWIWDTLTTKGALAAQLRAAGVPTVRR